MQHTQGNGVRSAVACGTARTPGFAKLRLCASTITNLLKEVCFYLGELLLARDELAFHLGRGSGQVTFGSWQVGMARHGNPNTGLLAPGATADAGVPHVAVGPPDVQHQKRCLRSQPQLQAPRDPAWLLWSWLLTSSSHCSKCTFLCSHTPPFPTLQPMAPSRLITAPRLYYTRSLCIKDTAHSYNFMTA